VRVHQHGTTARRIGGNATTAPAAERQAATAEAGRWGDEPMTAVPEPADHAIGRSRGRPTAKIHTLADGRGRLLVVLLTGDKIHDSTMFAALLAALAVARPGPGHPRTRAPAHPRRSPHRR
jgi:hypothetical protein